MNFIIFFLFLKEMNMLESEIQNRIIKELENRYPGAVVLKTDPSYIQGFPDLLFLYSRFWAGLEVKRTPTSSQQPNQEFWVGRCNDMSFGRFIFPENTGTVLNEMDREMRKKFRPRMVRR